MRWLVLVLVLALTAMIPSRSVVAQLGFFDGNELYEICQSPDDGPCYAYILGVHDAVSVAAEIYGIEPIFCTEEQIISDQLADVVIAWLYENPAERHRGAAELINVALQQAFPCP